MEKIIINGSDLTTKEQQFENHIIKSIEYLQKYKEYIKLSGKILYYSEKPILYYYCTVYSNTKINPFEKNIIFNLEFIDKEIPYISISSGFQALILNDNRNFYRCLSKKYDYRFSLDELNVQEKILEDIILGIENFFNYVQESLALNVYIFFGQYEKGHIYQINDFLKYNNNLYYFFRINDLSENNEKYIITTELYFFIFEPIEKDKSLGKLLFYEKLKNMNMDLLFEKNKESGNLFLKLKETKYKKNFEFEIINRKRKNQLDEINSNLIIDEANDKNSEFYDCIELIKEMNNKLKKYDIIIEKYKIFFNDDKNNFKIRAKSENKVKELKKCVEFYEKLLELYDTVKNKENRVEKVVNNMIYLCSELVNYTYTGNEDENKYLQKIRKYILLQKLNK